MEYAPSKNKLYRGDYIKRLMEKILYQKNNSSKKSIKVKENL